MLPLCGADSARTAAYTGSPCSSHQSRHLSAVNPDAASATRSPRPAHASPSSAPRFTLSMTSVLKLTSPLTVTMAMGPVQRHIRCQSRSTPEACVSGHILVVFYVQPYIISVRCAHTVTCGELLIVVAALSRVYARILAKQNRAILSG